MKYLVYSFEHRGFWPLDRCGYVNATQAGEFTLEEATSICIDSSITGHIEELMVPVTWRETGEDK